jgi:hypothetical protein
MPGFPIVERCREYPTMPLQYRKVPRIKYSSPITYDQELAIQKSHLLIPIHCLL